MSDTRRFPLTGPGPWHVQAEGVTPFDSLILSPAVEIAFGAAVEIEVMTGSGGRYTEGLSLGEFPTGSRGNYALGDAKVQTDVVRTGVPADGYSVLATPRGRAAGGAVTVTTYRRTERKPFSAVPGPAWGRELDVPHRSQMAEAPSIARRICSPTSVAMILAFHGINLPTAEVAAGVYDRTADIYGNWPFNTSFAAAAGRDVLAEAFVARMESLEEAEAEIAAGRPLALSHKWRPGELTDAPLSGSDGHLVVLRGFSPTGDPVVNDPAADPRQGQSVRRTYPRRELYHTWLENSEGIVYLFRPKR